MAEITAEQVWKEIEDNMFAILGMVTANNQARTAGIVYVVQDHKLYIGTDKDAWKVRHIDHNPSVSMTVTIAKRIPLLFWIKIPAATITFNGTGRVLTVDELSPATAEALFKGLQNKGDIRESSRVIEVQPEGDCITYGVGVSLNDMRDTVLARGRVSLT